MDWTEAHRPTSLSAIRGNDKARDTLREWATSWDDHHKPALLYGSPGVGKTSAAHALATDMGWNVIELNASDQRTADEIERYAGRAAKNASLGETSRQLIILDEADSLHGNIDRGGSKAISTMIKEAGQPIVLVANDIYDMSRSLTDACEQIQFRDLSTRSIVPALRDICRKEGIDFEEGALKAIAEASKGDLRSAINDLQALAETGETLTEDDVVTSERDREAGLFDFLDDLLKSADPQAALEASYDVDETPDDLINWIEENLPKEYEGKELAGGYRRLSCADRWLGRVRATQEYSYWRYAGDAMTAGVAVERDGQKGGWTRYGPPSYWSKLGRSRGARDTRDYIARHIAQASGISMESARRDVMPFLATMTHHCQNRALTVTMAAQYDLDASQVAFITGSGEDTNKVQSIVEEAQAKRGDETAEHGGAIFEPSDESPDEEDEETEDPATLSETVTKDEVEEDDLDEDEPAEADDSQSGLGDFM